MAYGGMHIHVLCILCRPVRYQTCIYFYVYIYVFYTHAYLTDPEYQSLLFLHFLVFKQLQNVTQNKGGKLNTPWIQLPWNPFAALQFFLTKICILGVTQCQHQHDVFCYLTRCACVFFVVVLQRISVILILSIFFDSPIKTIYPVATHPYSKGSHRHKHSQNSQAWGCPSNILKMPKVVCLSQSLPLNSDRLPVDVSGSQLLFGIMFHMIYKNVLDKNHPHRTHRPCPIPSNDHIM